MIAPAKIPEKNGVIGPGWRAAVPQPVNSRAHADNSQT